MARWLYKLGSWSARRAGVVVAVWAVLLGGFGAAAANLSQPFTSKMTIPGTEFQNVLDDLQQALPKAAGGSGGVVFSTTDGTPFTATQQAAISAVVKQWKATDGVSGASNPFTTQKKLDDAKGDLTDGKAKITKAKKKLADAKVKIADGRHTIAVNVRKLNDAEVELDKAQEKIDSGRKKLKTGQAKLNKSAATLKSAQTTLTAGREQLDEALAAKGMTEASASAALTQLNGAIDQLQAQLSALIAQSGENDPQVDGLRKQIAGYQAQADQLIPVQQSIDKLNAGQAQLDAGVAKIAAGQRDLNAGRKGLQAGQKLIDANRVKLIDGKDELAKATVKLDKAAAKIKKAERKLVDSAADLVRGQRQVALTTGLRFVSTENSVAVSTVQFTVPSDDVSKVTRAAIPAAASGLAAAGVTVDYSKDILGRTTQFGTEAVGLAVAAVVLLVMLGSLLAAGLPLLTALVGVGVGLLGVVTLTHWVPMTDVTPILALMLGLAVGIDYALFLVNRHRHQLTEGAEMIDSIARATGTAGSAVVVAGLTVLTALAALTLTGIPFLGIMGLAAAATIGIAVLVSITLTPALLRFIGPRILSPKGRKRLAAKVADPDGHAPPARPAATAQGTRGKGWGGLVTRHPLVTLGASVTILAILAVPAASLKLGLPDAGFEPADSTAYRAYTLVSDNFGAGQNGAIIGVAKVPAAAAETLTKDELTNLKLDIAERLKTIPGIDYVVPASASKDHQTLVFQIVPATGPSDDATSALVDALRADRGAIIADTGITSLGFTGTTVANIDVSARLAGALPGYLAVVVGISLILLLLVFRSLLVPLLATAGFLLSIAASLGGVVAVYQWGWFGSVFGVQHAGVILSFLPTLAIGILFGLAMDYQMFLVSGMREAWAHGEDPRAAVRTGFRHGSKVVTAAALIMMGVFGSFMYSHTAMIRPIGFTLAFGVLLDAFVVRMTIMPAVMHLLGEKAWYLPKWLDRILPDLDVEGAKLAHTATPGRAAKKRSTEPTTGDSLPQPA